MSDQAKNSLQGEGHKEIIKWLNDTGDYVSYQRLTLGKGDASKVDLRVPPPSSPSPSRPRTVNDLSALFERLGKSPLTPDNVKQEWLALVAGAKDYIRGQDAADAAAAQAGTSGAGAQGGLNEPPTKKRRGKGAKKMTVDDFDKGLEQAGEAYDDSASASASVGAASASASASAAPASAAPARARARAGTVAMIPSLDDSGTGGGLEALHARQVVTDANTEWGDNDIDEESESRAAAAATGTAAAAAAAAAKEWESSEDEGEDEGMDKRGTKGFRRG